MDRILRPKAQVLPDSALIQDAPTHTVLTDQPYFSNKPTQKSAPTGTLLAGSQLTVLSKSSEKYALVKSIDGRYFYVTASALDPII